MNPAPGFSLSLITKVAALDPTLGKGDEPAILRGFVDYLQKDAGLSDGEAFGVVLWFAELGGMEKVAFDWAHPVDSIYNAGKEMGSGLVRHGAEVADRALGWATAPHVEEIKRRGEAATAEIAHQGEAATAEIAHQGGLGREAATKAIETALHPKALISKGLESYPQIQGVANKIIGGDFSGGISDAWKGISNNETFKTIAPYAVAGIGSYLAGKATGQGTLGSAAMGLVGGAAGGYAWNNWDKIKAQTQLATTNPKDLMVGPDYNEVKETNSGPTLGAQTRLGAATAVKQLT